MSQTAAADARNFDTETVIHRLEEAGASLLALPGSGWSTKLRSSSLDIVKSAVESYGWTTSRIRPTDPIGGKYQPHGRGNVMDHAHPIGSLRATADRRGPPPGAAYHRTAPLPLATPRDGAWRGSQGDPALACPGDRADRRRVEPRR